MKRVVLLLLLTLPLAPFAESQGTREIYKHLNYHRDHLNKDSSLYWVDKLIEFCESTGKDGSVIVANFQKINTLVLFNEHSLAFELALHVQEEYCSETKKSENCEPCSYIYEKLTDFMITMQDYRQGINYLTMNCSRERQYYYDKALLYCLLDEADSALLTTNEGITSTFGNENLYFTMEAYNAHGLIAKRLGKLDTAIDAFSTAIDYADSLGRDIRKHAYIIGNLGSCYHELGELDKAYECLLIDSEGSLTGKQYGSHIFAELTLASIDIEKHDYQKANERLQAILNNFDLQIKDAQKLQALELLMNLNKQRGNNALYDKYSRQWIDLSKRTLENKLETHRKLVEQYSAKSLKQVQKQLETEKSLSAQQRLVLEKDKERIRLRNWLIIIGLALVGLLLLFFFLRWRSIARAKEVQLKLSRQEQDILELKVENESKNVQVLSLELSLKKDFSKSLIRKLQKVESITRSDLKNIELFIQNELEIKSTRAELQNQMGELSSAFIGRLHVEYPNITESDIKLASMIAMGMSNKDIATSRNITPGSVRIAKNRLKKKMNLPETSDLTEHLKSFL